MLLEGGADPKLKDGTTGDMPAHAAAYMCVPSALQALIDAGAGDTMDLENNKGDTPIFLAAKGKKRALAPTPQRRSFASTSLNSLRFLGKQLTKTSPTCWMCSRR